MRVSAKAEYACIAMFELALEYGNPQPARVKSIAEAHGIPQRFLVQILLQLKAAGLVASTRGAAGGYQLLRPPDRISLGDVINAIDRSPSARTDPLASPLSPAIHAIRSAWQEIDETEQRMLREFTFAELIRRARPASALTYQI